MLLSAGASRLIDHLSAKSFRDPALASSTEPDNGTFECDAIGSRVSHDSHLAEFAIEGGAHSVSLFELEPRAE